MTRCICMLMCTAALAGCVSVHGGVKVSGEPHQAQASEVVLRHVVLFAFKESTPEATVAGILEGMEALPGQIDDIERLEYGPDVSGRGLNRGFAYCAVFTFANEAARDRYLPHPDHQAFVTRLRPHLAEDGLLVFDYWTEK